MPKIEVSMPATSAGMRPSFAAPGQAAQPSRKTLTVEIR
jgi:hypothetical protein